MSKENEKISPGQCHTIGGQVSDRLFKSNANFEIAQDVSEVRSHPFWAEFDGLVQKFLVVAEVVKATIIEWLGDLVIPAQGQFEVATHFTKTNPNGVQFWDFGPNFISWFMPMTEKGVGETKVALGKLRVKAIFSEMTPELGTSRVVTTSQIYWMICQQPNGEKPDGKKRRLAVDGSVTILRALDKDGKERAVGVYWDDGGGWRVFASGLEYERQWNAGHLVVSSK
ncbi:MAG: hypothetical protein AAB909_02325 [Patescibacteria group bacterium]